MSSRKSNGLMTAAFLLSVGATMNVFAQQNYSSEGIVRITDGRMRTNARPAASPRVTQVSSYQNTTATAPSTDPTAAATGVKGGISNGYCPDGSCPGGAGQCPYCQGGHGGCFNEHCCKHSPDYGYSPPAKYPLHRRGVEYTSYFPAQWYGAGADYSRSQAPMVYQPTDTTQLGFYYQHVPFWQPQPNRVPERPIPAQWHIHAPAIQAVNYNGGFGRCRSGYCPNGYGVMDSCPTPTNTNPQDGNGPGSVVPSIRPTPVPADQKAPVPVETQSPATLPPDAVTYESGTVPYPLPQPQVVLPSPSPTLNSAPLPPTNSAASGHIRRIGY